MNRHIKGGFFIIASMLLFSFIGIFVRVINRKIWILLFYGGLIGFLILTIYLIHKKGMRYLWPKKYKWLLFLSALIASGVVSTYFQAYRTTTFANTVLLHYTAPIFAAIFAPIFLKERIDKPTIISLALSSLGIILIVYKEGFSLSNIGTIGSLFALASGILYGFSILANKKLSAIFDPSLIMFYQYGFFLLWPLFMKPEDYIINQREIILIVIYTLIFSMLPALLYLTGLKDVKAQHAGIIAYVEVLAAISYGYLFFNESPSLLTIIGGALVILSGYIVMKAEFKRR